jgi:hypothetical protein
MDTFFNNVIGLRRDDRDMGMHRHSSLNSLGVHHHHCCNDPPPFSYALENCRLNKMSPLVPGHSALRSAVPTPSGLNSRSPDRRSDKSGEPYSPFVPSKPRDNSPYD